MGDTTVNVDEAVDAIDGLCRSAADIETLGRLWRRARRSGRPVDEAKATTLMRHVIRDLMDDVTLLAQGDDEDRETLCDRVAAALWRKAVDR